MYTLHMSCHAMIFGAGMNTDPSTFKIEARSKSFHPLLYNWCQMVPWQCLRWCCVAVPILMTRIYASKILWLIKDAKYLSTKNTMFILNAILKYLSLLWFFSTWNAIWNFRIYVFCSKIIHDCRWNCVIFVSRRTRMYSLNLSYSTHYSLSVLG